MSTFCSFSGAVRIYVNRILTAVYCRGLLARVALRKKGLTEIDPYCTPRLPKLTIILYQQERSVHCSSLLHGPAVSDIAADLSPL